MISLCKAWQVHVTEEKTGEESLYEWFNTIRPDLVFVIGYPRKIKTTALNIPKGIYNVHFSRLPAYRGANPVFWQLKKQENTLGCSIHLLTEKIDAGPLVWQKDLIAAEYLTHSYVEFLLSNIFLEGVDEILHHLDQGNFPPTSEQFESNAAYFSKPTFSDVLINWKTMNAAEICALTRACNSWNNGAITLYNGMEIKISDASWVQAIKKITPEPGIILSTGTTMMVAAMGDQELLIHSLSINGIPIPGRYAKEYGFKEGQKFSYPSD